MKASGLAAAGFLGQQRRNLPVARGGAKAGFAGEGGTLTFNAVNVACSGTYPVTIAYLDGSGSGRQASSSVHGGAPQTLSFTPTGSFSVVGTITVSPALAAGTNTIEFANPSAFAPDLRPDNRG